MGISSFLFGDPLKTESMESERLTKVKALAVFSSDAVSSVTYATEEILLALGAILAASYAMPVAGVITALIFVVSSLPYFLFIFSTLDPSDEIDFFAALSALL